MIAAERCVLGRRRSVGGSSCSLMAMPEHCWMLQCVVATPPLSVSGRGWVAYAAIVGILLAHATRAIQHDVCWPPDGDKLQAHDPATLLVGAQSRGALLNMVRMTARAIVYCHCTSSVGGCSRWRRAGAGHSRVLAPPTAAACHLVQQRACRCKPGAPALRGRSCLTCSGTRAAGGAFEPVLLREAQQVPACRGSSSNPEVRKHINTC